MRRLALLALVLAPQAAHADPEGDRALAAVDQAMNRAKSHYFEYEAVTEEPGRGQKKVGLIVRMQGERRLTEFTAPADLKGTKVLVVTPVEMYAYLPAFGKVRRIASHTTDQSAFGMTFSQDDFASQRYTPDYTATIAAQDDKQLELRLLPKPGGKARYPRITLLVAKQHGYPTELRYLNAAGQPLKTETRTGYTCEGPICVPGELKMTDHTKGGMWTRITRKQWKLNPTFGDDVMSKRNLDR